MLFTNSRSHPPDPRAKELSGTLSQVTQDWENDDGTHTIVAKLEDGMTVRGTINSLGELRRGGFYRFLGRWDEHPRWGWQFQFVTHTGDAPRGGALAAYLAKWCQGIGPATAQKLVDAYGDDTARILVENHARPVLDGLLKADVAAKAAQNLKSICDPAMRDAHLDLYGLFRGHGFYDKCVSACLREWKTRAPAIVRRDPFVLLTAGMPGCGFSRCDKLYQALGLNPRRLKRQGLAAWYALRQRDGDTWLLLPDALAAVRQQIGGAEPREKRAVALMIRAGWLAYRLDSLGGKERHWLAEREKAQNERDVCLRVQELSTGEPLWPRPRAVPGTDSDGAGAVSNADTDTFASLSEHQSAELRKALSSRVCILTGSPGTGKTYTAAAVIAAAVRQVGKPLVAVVAPTGKAAVRITEKMQEAGLGLQATTIHRLLSVKAGRSGLTFEAGPDSLLPHRYIFADEMSMADIDLAAALLRSCGRDCHLLIVGDKHQLPPVGHGAFLRDLIDAGVPTARLSEIRRNAGRIVHTCAAIKDGKLPDLPDSLDDYPEENLIHLNTGRASGMDRMQVVRDKLETVYGWLKQQGKWDLVDGVQVICARNVTRKSLNRHLQAQLNPVEPAKKDGVVRKKEHPVFREGDKVICLQNGFLSRADVAGKAQEYVANGDIGRVEGFRGRQLLVRLQAPNRLVAVPLRGGKVKAGGAGSGAGADGAGAEEMDDADPGDSPDDERDPAMGCNWDLAYAVTCHKFQGSECPVVIVLVEGAGKLGSREWLYTALSRARELCVVIGDRAELSRCVRNETLPDRKTHLVQLLKGEMRP